MNCFIAAILGGVLLLSSPRNPTEPVPVTLESSECCQSAELSVKLECEPMHVAGVQPEVDIQCIEWEPAAERKTTLTEKEYYVLAKLLYAEAGGMSRTGQIYVCSAILNLSEQTGKSIWELAHAASIKPRHGDSTPDQGGSDRQAGHNDGRKTSNRGYAHRRRCADGAWAVESNRGDD